MNLVEAEAVSFSGIAADAGRASAAAGARAMPGLGGDWESSTELTPELRVQARRGFRAVKLPIAPDVFLVTVVPDYGTNIVEVARRRRAARPGGVAGWGLRLLPERIRAAAQRALDSVARAHASGALRSVLKPAVAASLNPAREAMAAQRALPATARNAVPAALTGALALGVADALPLAAAPGALAYVEAHLPALRAYAAAQGAEARALDDLERALPGAIRALPRPAVNDLLPDAVEQHVPGQMERTVPPAMVAAFRAELSPRVLCHETADGVCR